VALKVENMIRRNLVHFFSRNNHLECFLYFFDKKINLFVLFEIPIIFALKDKYIYLDVQGRKSEGFQYKYKECEQACKLYIVFFGSIFFLF